MTATEQTRRVSKAKEHLDSLYGSLIGATVVAIIAISTIHLVRSEPYGFERVLIGGAAGGIGGIIGVFLISEIVSRRWVTVVLVSLTIGILDGLLVGVAVSFFPSIF